MGPAGDFDARFEFQGAEGLAPAPGGGDAPNLADALSDWVDVADIGMLNGKRYFRWRFRFFVNDSFPIGVRQLPSIFNVEIPFEK